MDKNHLTIFGRTEDMVTAWKDPDMDDIVSWIKLVLQWFWLFMRRLYQASAEVFGLLQVEEPQISICVGADKVRFELMHRQTKTLFFRYNKIDVVFKVEHLPHFHNSIFSGAADQIVLVELILVACTGCHLLLRRELIRRHVFEIKTG